MLGGALAVSAASIAVLVQRPPLGLWPSLSEFAADYRTETGQRQQIALADNVSIDMNTQTSLNIRKVADRQVDRVELIAGEAAITTRSRRVEVVAANGGMWADNAQFNVRHDRAEVCVTCLAGRVHVDRQGLSAMIGQGEQTTYGAHGLGQTTAVDPAVVTGWREGSLLFRDQPLARVIEEVNRYRPGKIVLMNEALGRRRVTAQFKLDQLDIVITQLRESLGAQVTALPGGIMLVS
ncbi:FecR domain-containing protein [Bradyrhizobium sp. Ai1a-2]|uniref:FecR family protein n=1 Tax=Bradyrhizobium sp. Ai1a-2 TaxID=196490 RepID=UPI001FCC003E|nr:FecR domain-containing protein [Bradyrhizobium sp. Ai1a-2]